ncbi:MAG: hypothetical protein O6852_02570, partial [Gammaproteobacteria bacterium]|nr:hypothetical protein [Gammaproteobacteria bacterium]
MSTKNATLTEHSHTKLFFLQNSDFGWVTCTLITALLLSIPVVTVLSSVFLPASEVWQHIKATVLSNYIS